MEHVLGGSALERFPHAGGELGVVHRRRRGFVADLDLRQLVLGKTIHPADIDRDPLDAFEQCLPRLLIVRANGELHFGAVGNDVVLETRMEGADRDDAGLERRDLAADQGLRSEEHTSELQSLMRISYAVFCLKKQNTKIRK